MLKKDLYGLKQAPKAWYSEIEAYFAKEQYERCSSEHTLFTKRDNETMLSKDDNGVALDETKFKQAIGSLMYLTVTQPDLMYGVGLISRFMANPKESH